MDGDQRKLSFLLDADAARELEQLARRNERSASAELRRAVQAHLAPEDDDPPSRAGRVTSSANAQGLAPNPLCSLT